ncbi:TonB-dependent receptor [Sphingobacterium spiritivorum]|uniref:TonB-dependent receptor n=1 Tax=Sphingobacterium spiritivorum TaxID=258 RepID=UPI00191A75FD|nr:TonB-dependent receptor [Sphingobacterium spiritivorum]QQT25736.1 TonB-dependent receptor [Sphingobacterium spiritivorum]
MKTFIFFIVAILCQLSAMGQQIWVKGRIINLSRQPVEFVHINLLNKDSVRIHQAFTDSLGYFSIQTSKGDYQLVIEQFGKEFKNIPLLLRQDTTLADVEIDEVTELDGVTVTGRKKQIEQKVDRLVFHVENSTFATGGTALDALKATPTVRVQNENISIVGKGNVLVMIDDRLQRMSEEDVAVFLKSIPADNIKSIEVITTPPAKYDAEGNSGLINIKLKTAKANSWTANIGTTYTQKTYAGSNLQGLFNYNHNRLSLQTSMSKGTEKLSTRSDRRIFYTDELWTEEVRNKSVSSIWSLGLGADYKITDKWSTGVKYLGSFTDRTSANNPLTTRFNASNEIINSYITSDVEAHNKPEMNALNWYHNLALDSSGKNITMDLDYFRYKKGDYRSFAGHELDPNRTPIPNSYFSSTNSNINTIKNYSGKIDVSLPYNWANLSFGGKISYTNTNNDLQVYDNLSGTPILNTDQSNVFNYKEYNEALYFSAHRKLNEHWETQFGMRMEATQTEGYSANLNQANKNNYIRFFPTAYVTYVPNDSNSFSLNYSRRIRRPDFDYLNPFVIRTSPYYYSEGNPFLKPSFIDNLEFSYIYKQKWMSSVYFSRVSDFGQELSIVDPVNNVTRSTPLNYADTYQIGYSTYYNFSKWSWWNSFTGFNVNYQHVKSKTNFVESVDGYNAYFYSNNDFTLNSSKSIFFGLNYGLQLPGRYQIFHISRLHIMDISMKFLLLNKNLTLTVTGEDLLNAQRPLISYYSNGIKNDVRSYHDSRGFRISVSYKFGNKEIKSRQRNFGNEEERERTK